MRITMIYNVNLKTQSYLGVKKKMLGQAKGFSANGCETRLVCLSGSSLVETRFHEGKQLQTKEIGENLPIGVFWPYLDRIKTTFTQNEILYIRYNRIKQVDFLDFLRAAKQLGVTVCLEVPTFPYDEELTPEVRQTDTFYRSFLPGLIQAVFSPSPDIGISETFGGKYFPMTNGIDFENTPISSSSWNNNNINFIGIGWLSKWHGFERIIEPLANSSPDSHKFHFYIVGDGPHKETLQNLTLRLNAESKVTFTGSLDGHQLDSIFNKSHIAVSSLGDSQLPSLTLFQSLKAREYLARGLPIIVSPKESLLINNLPGVYSIPPGDSEVNLHEIEQFCSSFYSNNGPHIHRAAAMKLYDWKVITQRQIAQIKTIISQT